MDHNYNLPNSHELKTRLDQLSLQKEKLEKSMRNAKGREKRSRINCLNLIQELKENKLLSDELQAKMEAYSGMSRKTYIYHF